MTKAKYYERLNQGLCPRCGKANDGEFKYCEKCRVEERERRLMYIKFKVCPICKTEKLYGDERTCLMCKGKKSEYSRKRREVIKNGRTKSV